MDKYRLCVDYRMLNQKLPDSAWPSPVIDHCLDAAAGSKYLSSLDFNNGYFQIPCIDSAKYALAFSPDVGFGQYTFSRMPQGVESAASFFQQSMDKTFRGLKHFVLPPYFDDVNIKGLFFNDNCVNVRLVLTRSQNLNRWEKVTPPRFVMYFRIYLDNFISWHQQEQDM